MPAIVIRIKSLQIYIHPCTLICLWVWLALLLPVFGLPLLCLVGSGLLLLVWWRQKVPLLLMLQRNRVLLLSILVLYAIMTPGEVLFSPWSMVDITREGLVSGAQQALRLLILLAALVWLLGMLSTQDLLRGMLLLLQPLRRFGLDGERVAIRLALTLRYAGSNRLGDWHAEFLRVFSQYPNDASEAPVTIVDVPMRLTDWLLLSVAILLFILIRMGT